MRTATVEELRESFDEIEAALAHGESIEILKQNKVIATMVPAEKPVPLVVEEEPVQWPDFEARRKRIWGDRVFSFTAADMIAEDRDRY